MLLLSLFQDLVFGVTLLCNPEQCLVVGNSSVNASPCKSLLGNQDGIFRCRMIAIGGLELEIYGGSFETFFKCVNENTTFGCG